MPPTSTCAPGTIGRIEAVSPMETVARRGAGSACYGQGAADVLNVPLLENQPLTPRLGDEW